MSNTAILSVRVLGDADSAVSSLDRTQSAASKVAGGIGKAFKVGVGTVATGAAIGLGAALTGGFKRLSGIENAQAKMKGLGYDTKQVQGIMDNALASVEGTAFSLDAAATTAAGAVSAGIKPGKDLQLTLDTVANSAAAAGTDMETMGSIFNKAATAGKAQNDVLGQLADRGLPIYQELGKVLGVTGEEVFKLASEGKVSFAQFQEAAANASGDVAKHLGGTATGSIMNFRAAVSNFGASLLGGVFPHIAPIFQAITARIKDMSAAVGPAAQAFGDRFGGAIQKVATWILQLDFSDIRSFFSNSDWGSVQTSFSQIGDSLKRMGPAVKTLALAAPGAIAIGMKLLAAGLKLVSEHSDKLVWAIPAIVGGFLMWRSASGMLSAQMNTLRMAEVAMAPVTLANNILRRGSIRLEMQHAAATSTNTAAQNIATAATTRGTVANAASRAVMLGKLALMAPVRVALLAWAGAQRVLNLAMRANPIGLVITAIGLLVGAVVWAWNNVDWFRNGVVDAWNWIKSVSLTVWNAVKTGIGAAWTWIVNIFKRFHPVGIIVSHWDKIKSFTSSAWNAVKTFISGAWNAIVMNITTRITGAVNSVRTGWNNAKQMTVNAWNGIVTSVTQTVVRLLSVVRGIPGKIKSGLGNLGSLLKNAGKALITGFINGIKGAVGAAVDAVKGVVSRVRDLFPFSPAKDGPLSGRGYTTFSGAAMIGDFAKAIAAEQNTVRRATEKVMNAAALGSRYEIPTIGTRAVTGAAGLAPAPGRRAGSGVVKVEINFTGLVTDKHAVAREIKKILKDHDVLIGEG